MGIQGAPDEDGLAGRQSPRSSKLGDLILIKDGMRRSHLTTAGVPDAVTPDVSSRIDQAMTTRIALLAAASAAALSLSVPAVRAADLPTFAAAALPETALPAWSPWMLRIRALGVRPDPGARLSAAGTPLTRAGLAITDAAIPELDITYFFTRNLAAELILGVTRHGIQGTGALAGTRIGTTWILPPTLTLQYHFDGFGAFKPYVGAGVNYSIFFGEQERGGFTGFRLTNSFAPALQVGFDYMLDEHWGLNVDVKKLLLDTKVKLNAGAIRGGVDIDPWIVGGGVTYRF